MKASLLTLMQTRRRRLAGEGAPVQSRGGEGEGRGGEGEVVSAVQPGGVRGVQRVASGARPSQGNMWYRINGCHKQHSVAAGPGMHATAARPGVKASFSTSL